MNRQCRTIAPLHVLTLLDVCEMPPVLRHVLNVAIDSIEWTFVSLTKLPNDFEFGSSFPLVSSREDFSLSERSVTHLQSQNSTISIVDSVTTLMTRGRPGDTYFKDTFILQDRPTRGRTTPESSEGALKDVLNSSLLRFSFSLSFLLFSFFLFFICFSFSRRHINTSWCSQRYILYVLEKL